jgi:hypothetical protein
VVGSRLDDARVRVDSLDVCLDDPEVFAVRGVPGSWIAVTVASNCSGHCAMRGALTVSAAIGVRPTAWNLRGSKRNVSAL